jgi:hypothetical protein
MKEVVIGENNFRNGRTNDWFFRDQATILEMLEGMDGVGARCPVPLRALDVILIQLLV